MATEVRQALANSMRAVAADRHPRRPLSGTRPRIAAHRHRIFQRMPSAPRASRRGRTESSAFPSCPRRPESHIGPVVSTQLPSASTSSVTNSTSSRSTSLSAYHRPAPTHSPLLVPLIMAAVRERYGITANNYLGVGIGGGPLQQSLPTILECLGNFSIAKPILC